MPARSLSPRRLPQRSRSFDMKGLLHRSLPVSFSSKRSSPSINAKDEQNVFCADIISTDFIIDKLKEVRNNAQVLKLEIEDLLTSPHGSVLSLIKAIAISGSRDWQWVRFVDTVDPYDFAKYQQQKKAIMQDYQRSIDDTCKYQGIISFDTTFRIAQGTPSSVLLNTLQSLDQDQTVTKVTFQGDLFGLDEAMLPSMLNQRIDPLSGETTGEVSIAVIAGWTVATVLDWKMMLSGCIQQLQRPKNSGDVIPPMRRVRTADGQSAPRMQMPRRPRSLRRLKSAEDNPAPRRLRRTGSMQLLREVRRHGAVDVSSPSPLPERRPRRRRQMHVERRAKKATSNHGPTKKPEGLMKSERSMSSPPPATKSLPRELQSFSQDTTNSFREDPDYDWAAGIYLNSHVSKAA
ncbi:expressed unknown protein [Seminavis robusta]|uniref:Uncharacterized protein n=1 Tax=Seminavis robusta TaxID=568900 RepID=A0A9N8HSS7_9STRA|nr:expressed unknown protein [Seminavis robusta]|eukprot:Sro1766_g296230.1 n/a (404) ;mRNA; f:9476-10777